MKTSAAGLKNITVAWDDAHHYSPAPRHRRRLLLKWLKPLEFVSCLDVGCAQPYLLWCLQQQGKKVFGCDISDQVVKSNRAQLPGIEFAEVDVAAGVYPRQAKFDVVVASEVLEHIQDWEMAVKNLCRMSRRYLLITVPGGQRFPIDKMVGHYRHFAGPELVEALEREGFTLIRQQHWGFPLHSLYKRLINGIAPKQVYASFGTARYSFFQILISQLIYALFFVNDWFRSGQQLLYLAQRQSNRKLPGGKRRADLHARAKKSW